jgi:hypothetical protein
VNSCNKLDRFFHFFGESVKRKLDSERQLIDTWALFASIAMHEERRGYQGAFRRPPSSISLVQLARKSTCPVQLDKDEAQREIYEQTAALRANPDDIIIISCINDHIRNVRWKETFL